MYRSLFVLSILCVLTLLPLCGRAQPKPLSRSEREKLNATFLREVSYATPVRIKELLAAGAELEGADEEGRTALMWTVRSGQLENVKTLIALHAKVNARDRSGRTTLFYAFMGSGQYHPSPQVVTALLDAGADVNAVSKYGETPLKMALATDNAATVALLKQHGARVGLAEAAFSGDSEQVQTLLRNGADIHSSAVTSALETAIRTEKPGVVKLLLAAGADPNARTEKVLVS